MRSVRLLAVVLLLVVGIGAVLVATGVLPPTSAATAGQYITATAARRDVTESVVASGTVAAATTYDLRFGEASQPAGSSSSSSNSNSNASTPTWPVTSVAVKVGDAVTAGDVLAVADPTNARLQLEIAKANLAAAQAKLTADKSAPTAATKAAASDALRQAQLQLSQAQSNYSHTVSQNAISLSQARSALSRAKSTLAKDKAAHAPSQTISADRAAVSQAQDNLTTTTAHVSASNAQAANQVSSAQLGLTSARHDYTNRLAKSTTAQLASDQASVATAQSDVDSAQLAVDNASLKAPIAGRVSAVNIVAGTTAPSGAAIEIQSSAMTVTAAFAESDVPDLKVGQATEVTIKAIGTDPVAGTVSSIAETSASGSNGVVSYDVTVALDEPAHGPAYRHERPGLGDDRLVGERHRGPRGGRAGRGRHVRRAGRRRERPGPGRERRCRPRHELVHRDQDRSLRGGAGRHRDVHVAVRLQRHRRQWLVRWRHQRRWGRTVRRSRAT